MGSCGDIAFVDEPAEAVSAAKGRRVAARSRDDARRDRLALIERRVRAMAVVVLNVRLHDAFEVASVHDQKSVEAFAAAGRRPDQVRRSALREPARVRSPVGFESAPAEKPARTFACTELHEPTPRRCRYKWHTHGTRSRLREELWLNHRLGRRRSWLVLVRMMGSAG